MRIFMAGIAALSIAACAGKPGNSELDWARAALARNADIEVVSADATAGIVTVRSKADGTVYSVKAADIVAAPRELLEASRAKAGAVAATRDAVAPPAAGASPADESTGAQLQGEGEAASVPAEATAAAGDPASRSDYTIEREAGRVRVTGPGISIQSSGGAAVAPASSSAAATAEAGAGASTERRAEPLVCQGQKFLRIDNRNIVFTGDGLVAQGGCELYVTNSRIVAAGVGLLAQDAKVHVTNSTIEGRTASIQAQTGAEVFAKGSTFRGIPRRFDTAELKDLGGNVWQ